MRFIDLFSGLGGFHLGLRKLGHECVFACELDDELQGLYEKNFGIRPEGDIRSIKISEIPAHDILCAGFPCQPFSKAGHQRGFACPESGDLFDFILQIASNTKPRYVLLENVPNIEKHDKGLTWDRLQGGLRSLGYEVTSDRLSPHHFGIPQIRERLFIVGSLSPLNNFKWPEKGRTSTSSIISVLDERPLGARKVPPLVMKCFAAWQEFIDRIPHEDPLPWFPVWAMEFGATYPYEDVTPSLIGAKGLRKYRGSFGRSLNREPAEQILEALPPYARSTESHFPKWKIKFIEENRSLFKANKRWIKEWLPKLADFPPSLQKFEWHCKGEDRDIWKNLLQLRASGVRVKRPNSAPSLVAMSMTQVPIVAWEGRYMTPRECARLQSLGELTFLPLDDIKAYKALGNAVNARVVELIASSLFSPTTTKRSIQASLVSPQTALTV
jgi:DNA (cytosine-5)-methyltransferase 1